MSKKLFNVASTFLDYGLALAEHSRADIAHLIRGYFIPCFLQSTATFCFTPFSLDIHAMHCNKDYKNVAALTRSMRKS